MTKATDRDDEPVNHLQDQIPCGSPQTSVALEDCRDIEAGQSAAKRLAVQLEPDLRLLKGLLTVLRYLGERRPCDTVDPAAIAALAFPAEDAVDRLIGVQISVCQDKRLG